MEEGAPGRPPPLSVECVLLPLESAEGAQLRRRLLRRHVVGRHAVELGAGVHLRAVDAGDWPRALHTVRACSTSLLRPGAKPELAAIRRARRHRIFSGSAPKQAVKRSRDVHSAWGRAAAAQASHASLATGVPNRQCLRRPSWGYTCAGRQTQRRRARVGEDVAGTWCAAAQPWRAVAVAPPVAALTDHGAVRWAQETSPSFCCGSLRRHSCCTFAARQRRHAHRLLA